MGNAIKYEAMELTFIEKKVIMESWVSLRRKLSVSGQTFIIIFLTDHPEYAAYFPHRYKGNPYSAEIHGLKVMREISRIVTNLDTLTNIEDYLRDVAWNHQPRNINPKAFDDLRVAYLKMIKSSFADHRHLTLYLKSWDKLFKLITTIIIDLMNDITRRTAPTTISLSEKSPRIQKTPKYEPPQAPPPSESGSKAEIPVHRHTRIKYVLSIEDI